MDKCCDIHTKAAYTSHSLNCSSVVFSTTTIFVQIGSKVYCDNRHNYLRFASRDTALWKYIMDNSQWTSFEFNLISWDSLRIAMRQGTVSQKKAYKKVIHKKRATNEFKSKMSNRNDHRCMRCNPLRETWEHTCQCLAKLARHQLTIKINSLHKFLQ